MKIVRNIPQDSSELEIEGYSIVFHTKDNRLIRIVLLLVIISWTILNLISISPVGFLEMVIFIALVLTAFPFYLDRYTMLEEIREGNNKWRLSVFYSFVIAVRFSQLIMIESIEYRIVGVATQDVALMVLHTDKGGIKIKTTNRRLKDFQEKIEINSISLDIRKRVKK